MKYLTTILLLATQFVALSQVKNLTALGFQWHEPTAWSPMGVPTANDSVLINGPTLIMPDSTAYARYVFVGPSGSLQIQRDTITNTPGRLFIANSPTAGLENEGSVTNGGRIDIDNSGTRGLWNNGTFEILTKAKLNVDSCTSDGISTGSTPPTLLDNYGSINISRAPFNTQTSANGLINYDSLHNHAGAEIMISNLGGSGSRGIFNIQTHTMINQGKIIIANNGGDGILNAGTFINEDTVIITNIGATGFKNATGGGTGPAAFLSNQLAGYISISATNRALDNGTIGQHSNVIDNLGQIHLDGSVNVGIENHSMLFIPNGGLISITNTTGDPLRSNAESVLDCQGQLDVTN